MRKGFVAAVLLLALGIFGVIFATNKINETADKVVFAENVIYGDRAYADGLTVLKEVDYAGNLAWKSTVKFTKDTFSYSTEYGREQVETSEEDYLFLYTDCVNTPSDKYKAQSALDREVSRLADTVAEGQTLTFSVYLADLYEFYPITFRMIYHGAKYGRFTNDLSDKDGLLKVEKMQKAFEDFFKIRVLDDEIIMVNIDKVISGNSFMEAVSDITGDSYSPSVVSYFSDRGIYFGICNRSEKGKVMDFSNVPGGYGVYYLPIQDGELMTEQLRMFFSLESNVSVENCAVSYEGTELHLITEEDGAYYFNSIALSNGELLQKCSVNVSDHWLGLFEEENFFVLTNEETLTVFTKNDEGIWQESFRTKVAGIETLNEYLPGSVSGSQYAFDGKRLAVMGSTYLKNRDGQKQWGIPGCGFYINVFDKDGLQFYATYDSSLDETIGFEEDGFSRNIFNLNDRFNDRFDGMFWQ